LLLALVDVVILEVPVFISHRDRLARLYPQALGSLIIASYDSQGYGGGIRTHLHTGEETALSFIGSVSSK
jgi:hypothetical protein